MVTWWVPVPNDDAIFILCCRSLSESSTDSFISFIPLRPRQDSESSVDDTDENTELSDNESSDWDSTDEDEPDGACVDIKEFQVRFPSLGFEDTLSPPP
jgi:hypothetical protein